jgi:nitrate reductase alpha subunit
VVERDNPNTFKRFTSLGPLMNKLGNGGKGIGWNTQDEVHALAELNGTVRDEGVSQGMPKIVSDIDATEVVLMLAPETNGHVAVKAWEALGKQTGRDHTHLAVEVFDGTRSVLAHHQSSDAVVRGVASAVVILQPAPENTIHARKHKMYQRYSIRSFLQNYISPDSALFHLYCAILYFYRIELKIR